MISTIISRVLFTCSTFLLLSASLLSMEFPGKGGAENRKEKSESSQDAIYREGSEHPDDDQADQDLERSLQGCQLSDLTSNTVQYKAIEGSALQNEGDSDTSTGMSDIQRFQEPVGNYSGSPVREIKTTVPVTPSDESHFGEHAIKDFTNQGSGKIPFVTPSPVKRASSPALSNYAINFESPLKVPRSHEILDREFSFISQQKIERTANHVADILRHVEEVPNSFVPIYETVRPEDYDKLEELSTSLTDVTSAITALKIIKNELEKAHASLGTISGSQQKVDEVSSYHTALFLKLRVATAVIQRTIKRAHDVAQALTSDNQYGMAIDTALNKAREMQPETANVLKQVEMLAQSQSSSVREMSSTPLTQVLHDAKQIFENKNNLIKNIATPALRVFGAVGDVRRQDELMQARDKVEAMALMMEFAIENAKLDLTQLSSSALSSASAGSENEGSLPAFDALKVTSEATMQALEEMKSIALHVQEYRESWPLDVNNILKNIR